MAPKIRLYELNLELLAKTSGKSAKIAEKWVFHFDKYSFTFVTNDIQLVVP